MTESYGTGMFCASAGNGGRPSMLIVAEPGSRERSSDEPAPEASTPGKRRQPFDQLLVECRDALRRRVLRRRQVEAEGEHAGRGEARILAVQRDDAAHQQTGADQQHEGDRQLSDGQRGADPAAANPVRSGAAAFLQVRAGVAARGVECRNDAEEQAGEQGCAKGIRDHLPVDGNVREPREARRRQGLKQLRAPRRDQQARGAADQAEQQALGQHLAQQSTPSGAERRPDRELALPARRRG